MTSIAEKYAAQWMPNGEVSLADLIQSAVDEAVESRRHEVAMHAVQQIKAEIGQSVPVVGEPDCYDAGLLNDFGGGNVGWWQDYIRAELARAHDFYVSQWLTSSIPAAELATLREKAARLEEAQEIIDQYKGMSSRYKDCMAERDEALTEQAVAVTGEPIAILRREIGEDTWFDWTPVLPNSKTHQQLKAAGEMDYCEVYQRYTQSIPAADLDALRKDAARYRWLREQYWNSADICVVRNPKESVKLGHDCPSFERLDSFIDAAIAQGKGE